MTVDRAQVNWLLAGRTHWLEQELDRVAWCSGRAVTLPLYSHTDETLFVTGLVWPYAPGRPSLGLRYDVRRVSSAAVSWTFEANVPPQPPRATWQRCPPGEYLEPKRALSLDEDSHKVVRVSIAAIYKMTCPKCQRPRYARMQQLPRIRWCKPCAWLRRNRTLRLAKWTPPEKSSRLPAYAAESVEQLIQRGWTQDRIAQAFGITKSGVSRLLSRRRSRSQAQTSAGL